MKRTLIIVSIVLGAGCRTEFTGSAHIDPGTCQAKCNEAHLQMAGMVYMGEYSSACICEIPRAPGPPSGGMGAQASAAAAGAAAGVVMQMRQQQDQQRRVP